MMNETNKPGTAEKQGGQVEPLVIRPHFKIGDIVECRSLDGLVVVTGVIHDENRLFVSDYFSSNSETEIDFDDVETRWRELAL